MIHAMISKYRERETKYYEKFVNAHQEDFAVEELGADFEDDAIDDVED